MFGEHALPVRSEVPGAGVEEHLVLLADDFVDGERDARVRHVDDDVDLVDVEPLAGDVGADVRLVLVIGGDDLDLQPLRRGAVVLHRHLRGNHRALPREIGIEAGSVVEHADFDDVVGHLRAGERRPQANQQAGDRR